MNAGARLGRDAVTLAGLVVPGQWGGAVDDAGAAAGTLVGVPDLPAQARLSLEARALAGRRVPNGGGLADFWV